MADVEEDQSEKTYFNPSWIAQSGSYIHSNNVLFYFASSPFFDRSSGNSSLEAQCKGDPEKEMRVLSTRSRFEANLRMLSGVQYVVAHDPIESNVVVEGPSGPELSNVWVIRKQDRLRAGEDDLSILAYYYIANDVIYQAPSLSGVLNYRMLNTLTSLNKIFSSSSKFPYFSTSYGHTYFRPIQKQANEAILATTQQSKEVTPAPDTQSSRVDQSAKIPRQVQGHSEGDTRVLNEALQMTLRYGKEYMDEMSLVGEPGNFRLSRVKDAIGVLATSGAVSKQQETTKSNTPAHSKVPSTGVVPPPQGTATAATASKSARATEKEVTPTEVPGKLKRRKSKAADSGN